MRVTIHTLGCKVNQYESEAMLQVLLEHGFLKCPENEPADVVIVNSCTVTAQSDAKVRQALRRLKKLNPGAVAVLTGCMPQAFPEQMLSFDEADIILGTKNRLLLPEYIANYLSAKQRIVDIKPHENGEKFESMHLHRFQERTRAFLKIQDGCNRFCSFCIIPYARGRVRSKPLADIEAEVRSLAENGYREIVLTGINLPAYGQELGLTLCDAVDTVCRVDGIKRVRLGSLEPERMGDDVIARFAAEPKLCPQFHLSLQSGCDATLIRMNRHYNTEDYRQIVTALRQSFPNAAITTDIMVGFAGETDEEFRQSLRFAEETGFAKVHVFAYSLRPGTRACDFPDQVPASVKAARSKEMQAVAAKTRLAFFREQLGRHEPVLVEKEIRENLYEGYTMNYTPVWIESDKNISGEIIDVQLAEIAGETKDPVILARQRDAGPNALRALRG